MIAGLAAGAAVAACGASAAFGNALFDFALNPMARRSFAGAIIAGDAVGIDFPQGGDPFRVEARAWFEADKQSVQITARDGSTLLGWFFPACDVYASEGGAQLSAGLRPPRGSAWGILCHGYAGKPADLAAEAYLAHQMGISLIVPAARGHERNRSHYIGMGWLDAHDLLRWIDLILGADPDARIALYGVSMGGAEVMMASGLELPDNVRCIVEDCGYTSVWDEFAVQARMQLHLPPVPALNIASAVCRARAGYGFRQASALRSVRRAKVPMLFIHGTDDVFVPFAMLDKVFEACAAPVKERLAIEGAGHAVSSVTAPDRYRAAIGEFLARHLF